MYTGRSRCLNCGTEFDRENMFEGCPVCRTDRFASIVSPVYELPETDGRKETFLKMFPGNDLETYRKILPLKGKEVNIFTHIRHMVYDQVPALLISLAFFLVLGFKYSGQISSPEVDAMMIGLEDNFRLGFAAFIPLLIAGFLLLKRLPALLCMLAGAVSGILVAIFYQGLDAATAFNTFYGGYHFETSNEMLSTLLNRGGISSMWSLVGVTLFGFTVAGMLDQLKVLEVIAASIMKTIHSITGVTVITILFGFIGNAVALSQNFAIVMSGTLMAPVYKKYNLHPKNCSRDLEAGGTYGAMFIPWNNNAVFCAGALGVGVTSYLPYIPLLYLTPVIVIFFSVIRFHMEKIYDDCGYIDVTQRLAEDPETQERLQA